MASGPNYPIVRKIIASHAFATVWALCVAASPAHADLWGYVDEQGNPHLAIEKLDDRYQLFFRGRSSVDETGQDADRTALEAFSHTPMFERIARHTNVVRFQSLIEQASRSHGVDPALVKAIVAVESSFEPAAASSKGAIGLMQLTPGTAARYGVIGDTRRSAEQKLMEPATNLRTGTRYLRDLLAMFDNDESLALAAYNAGEQAVRRYGNQIPPYAETQQYVRLVQQFYSFYRPQTVPSTPARITIPGRHRMP